MSNQELNALLALQDLDTHIDHESHRRATLPQRAQLSELDRTLAQATAKQSTLLTAVGEVASRQEVADRELKATEDRVAQVNTRLYGGTVSASRELQAMATDVDALKRRISDLEDRALGLMDEREPLDSKVAELDRQIAALGEQKASARESLAQAELEVDYALEEFSEQRPTVLGNVPANLLATYDRLRPRLGGVAVARLVGGRCDGCHLALPAVELDRIRHHDAGTLEYCEQCGRILVVPGD